MFFGRRRKLEGHAKQMAYILERPAKQAQRAQELLAQKPPASVPPLPPVKVNDKRKFWVNRKGWVKNGFARPQSQPRVVRHMFDFFGEGDAVNENHPFHDGYSFCHRLEKKGFKKLGSGAHSRVMAKDSSDKCIKVGCSADNWMQYVLWGRKMGYEGNFVPKVYSYKYFKGKDRPFYVAVVEKLARCSGRAHSHKDKDGILLDLFSPGVHDNPYAKAALNFLEPGCGDFAANLKQAANDNDWGFDIHGGNFMVRNNGTWVATDPVNSHGNAPKERIRTRRAA